MPKDGKCILIHKFSGQDQFSFWVSSTGIKNLAWNPNIVSGYMPTDGNWGQWVSPIEGTVDGTFIIGDSNSDNKGYDVYVRKGKEGGNDVALKGTLATDGDGDADHFGRHEYGNYSIGHVRGFTIFGTQYVAASTSGWPASYLTVQTTNPDDEDHYLLRTQIFETSQPSPSSEFYYDSDTGVGYLAFIAQNYSLSLYEITQERI